MDTTRRTAVAARRSSAVATLLLGAVTLAAAAAAAAAIQFTEVGVAAGLGLDEYETLSVHGLGLCWIDYDRDGRPDLFATNGASNPPHLYHNEGDGTFTDADALLGALPDVEMMGCVFADYDNDGDSDIYVFTDNKQFTLAGTNEPDGPPNLLLRNRWVENGGQIIGGTPLFADAACEAGVEDLAVPPLGDEPGMRAVTGGFLDYDRDGCVDLYIGHMIATGYGEIGNRDRLYRNNCNGTFSDVTAPSGVDDGTDTGTFRPTLAFLAAHLDSDLWPDMWAENVMEAPWNRDFHYRNNGDGTFTDATADSPGIGNDTEAGMGVDTADLDLDGDWDIYITDILFTGQDDPPLGNCLYLGNGDGTFADNSAPSAGVVADNSWGCNFFDADQDAYPDLFVATTPIGRAYLYRNDGDGTFTDVAGTAGVATDLSRGSATADYDGDGDLDLAVVDHASRIKLFRNDTTGGGNGLKVRLQATTSNRDAIGAVLEVEAGGLTLLRQVKGGSSAHSQDALEVHFGLGAATAADRLQVSWPSGTVDVLTGVAAGTTTTVVEGSSPSVDAPAIRLSPLALDFGPVPVGQSSDLALDVRNDGTLPLTVTALGATGAAFSVVGPAVPFVVAPAGQAAVTVRFAPGSAGAAAGELEVSSDDPDDPLVSAALAGEGTTGGDPAAVRVNAGGNLYVSGGGVTFEADQAWFGGSWGYSGGTAVTFSDAVAGTDDDLLYQDMRGGTFSYLLDLAGGEYDVTLHFQEPFATSAGRRKFDVAIEGLVVLNDFDLFAEAGGKNVALARTVRAAVLDGQLNVAFTPVVGLNAIVCALEVASVAPPPAEPDIAVTPSSVVFPATEPGESTDAIVTVSNGGSAPLVVSSLATDNPVFTVVTPAAPLVIAAGGSAAVTLRFSPLAAGAESGTLTVASDDPDEGEVAVTLAGTGVAAGSVIRFNCGGGDYLTLAGDLFVADTPYTTGTSGYTGGVTGFFNNAIAGTDDDTLYQYLRGGTFSYTFDGLALGAYRVTLYFSDPSSNGPGVRLFDVTAEGGVVLDNYDIYAEAGGKNTARNEEFAVTVSDGQLNLGFTPVRGSYAIVGAIVVEPN